MATKTKSKSSKKSEKAAPKKEKSGFDYVGIDVWNGNPTFFISTEEEKESRNKGNTLSFQMRKAKGLLENLQYLKEFVKSNGTSIGKDDDDEDDDE
jgi:hypothetical protein